MNMRFFTTVLLFGWQCACVADEAPFYLVSKGGWWYGPYRPEQRSLLDPVKTGESSDIIYVQTNQPYHGLFHEMGYRRIDLRRTGSGFFELSARCRDQSGHFLVDSGAGNEMLYQTFADVCGQEQRTIMDSTLGAVKLVALKEARTESGIDLNFPEYFVVRPDRKRSFQPEGLVPNRWEAFGIIGNGFLREQKAILDYDAEALFILPKKTSEDMHARMRAKMTSLGYHPIHLRWDAANRLLKVTVQIGANTTNAVVDTGASATGVDRPLAKRLGLDEVAGSRQRFEGEATIGWNTTAQTTDPQASRSTIHDFSVGGFPVHLRHGIAITDPGIPNDRGDECVIIGNDVLALYGAVLDLGQSVLYLRKSQATKPNQASDATSEPALDAASSSHQR